MSTTGSVPLESKSAKKRKAKAEAVAAATNGSAQSPAVDTASDPMDTNTVNGDSQNDSPFIKELTKNIRNIHKKLASSAKADAVIAENPDVAIDDLVAQKKLNADQKAQLLKKPNLKAQLAQLEEQLGHFRAFARELEDKAAKDKSSVSESHEAEIARVKDEAQRDAGQGKDKAVEDALRVVVQFLHTAASRRQMDDSESDEARAFEGALLHVYQGNDHALSTWKKLVQGADEKIADAEGESINYTFAQVKEASKADLPDVGEETEPAAVESTPPPPYSGTDQTIANAGLTELDDTTTIQAETNGTEPELVSAVPEQTIADGSAANAVAEGWDPQASIVTDGSAANDESWVQVPRDPAETETGLTATPAAAQSTSWAEEVGNAAATTEVKPAGGENDGFEQVRRERGGQRGARGGGRGGPRGEFRGRGRGGRGGSRGNRDGQNGGRGGGRGGGGGRPRGDDKS